MTHSELERKVQTLLDVIQAINARFSQQEVLTAMLERIVTDMGYKAATLRLLNKEQAQLELKMAYGLSADYLAKGIVDVSQSGIDQAALRGESTTIDNVSDDPRFQYPDDAAKEGLASMLALPLTVRDRVIGVLHVYSDKPHQFPPAEQAFIAAIANVGAQTIERARLFEAFQRIAHLINSSLKLDEVLTTLLIESVKEVNVKAGSIRLLGPERKTLHLAAAYGLSEAYLQKGPVKVAQSPVDQKALQEAQPVVITDVAQPAGFQYPEEASREGIRSALVIPLLVREAGVGVMRLYASQTRQFSAEEISFAGAIADLGSVAIENAKLHEALKQHLETLKADADGWYRFLTLS